MSAVVLRYIFLILGIVLSGAFFANEGFAQGDVIQSAAEAGYPPLSVVGENGEPTGFAVELLRESLSAVGREATFKTGSWAKIKKQLAEGEVSVLPLVGRSPEREKDFDFTFPYLSLRGTIFVRQDNDRIHSVNDLSAVTIAVMEGDNAHEYALRRNLGKEIVVLPTFQEALQGLAANKYDAVLVQKLVGLKLINRMGLQQVLKAVGPPLEGFEQRFCFAVKKGDHKLLSLLNEGLSITVANGTHEELQKKWLGEISQDQKFRNLVKIFFSVLITLAVGFWLAFLWQMMLRRKVSQRTYELNQANKELEKLRDHLSLTVTRRTQELETQTRRLDLALYGGNIAAWEWNLITDEVTVDERWRELLGVDDAQEINHIRDFNQRIHHEDRARIFNLVEQVIEGKQPLYDAQIRIRHDLKGYRWFSVRGRVTAYGVDDASEQMSGVLIDIHDRIMVEGQLDENRQLFRQLFEYTRSGVAVYKAVNDGQDFEFVDINPAGEKLVQSNRGELVGRLVTKVFPAVKSMGLFALLQKVYRTGEESELPLTQYADERIVQWLENKVYKLPNGYIVSLFDDTTHQRQAELFQRQSEEKYRALAENIPDAIVRFDNAGCCMYVNSSSGAMLGRPGENLVGKKIEEFDLLKDFAPVWNRCFERLIDTAEPVITDLSLIDETGQKRVFECRLFCEKNEKREIVSVLSIFRDISEQRRSEENYQLLFTQMQEGVALHEMIFDEQGTAVDYRFIEVNPAFEKLTGLKQADVIGKRVKEVLPDTEQVWIETYSRVVASGEPELIQNYSQELGRHFDVLAFRPRSGYFACLIRDVSQQVKSQQAVVQSEKRFRQLFEMSPIPLLEEDFSALRDYIDSRQKNGVKDFITYFEDNPDQLEHCTSMVNIIDANDAAVRLFEANNKEQLLGEVGQFIDQQSIDEFGHIINQIACGRANWAVETANTTLSGRPLDVIVNYSLFERDGSLGVVSISDITPVKEAQKAIRQSEERFRTVTESSHDGILIAENETGRFIYANPAISKMLQYTVEELLQMSVDDIHPAEHLEEIRRYFDSVTGGELSRVSAIPCQRKDGSVLYAAFTAANVEIDGKACHVGSFADVTEQRELEERLLHADKMKAIGELAGGVAHDFNNQLAGIMGYAGVLERRLTKEEEKTYARKIIKVASSAANLTSQLLTFARKGKYQHKPVNMNVLINEVIDLLRRTCDKQVVIQSSLRAQNPEVIGDVGMLQNALLNLGVNARDAMPGGGCLRYETANKQITKSNTKGLVPGCYLQITVSDTGKGMDEQTQKRIFEPFFSTKGEGEGTGLGLAAVYGAVEQHQGNIDVRSLPGEGAVFDILLLQDQENVD